MESDCISYILCLQISPSLIINHFEIVSLRSRLVCFPWGSLSYFVGSSISIHKPATGIDPSIPSRSYIYIYSILKFTQVHVLTTNQTMPAQCFLKINSETSTGHHAPWVPRVDAVSLEPFPVCRTCPPWLAWAHHRAFRVRSLATWSKRSPGLCHFTHEWPRTPIRQELKFQNQHRFLQDGKLHIFALGL